MKSTNALSAFATLRFAGDALDPDEISDTLKEKPTRAYRKGEPYRPGPRSPELIGKTGLWYFSTNRIIPSTDLKDHLDALIRLIAPFGDQGRRLRELHEIMDKRNLQAHVTCSGVAPPKPKNLISRLLKLTFSGVCQLTSKQILMLRVVLLENKSDPLSKQLKHN